MLVSLASQQQALDRGIAYTGGKLCEPIVEDDCRN